MSDAVEKIRKITKKIYWIGSGAEIATGESSIGGSCCADEITSSIVDSILLQELALQYQCQMALIRMHPKVYRK